MNKLYYKYWGKARKKDDGTYDYHLLPYHCLDVAAVGSVWLEQNKALCNRIAYSIDKTIDGQDLVQIVCFFLALHDLGKFDIRFQSKIPILREGVWPDLSKEDVLLSEAEISEFDHGSAGYGIFINSYRKILGLTENAYKVLDNWEPWIASVTGHHGVIPKSGKWVYPLVEKTVSDHDEKARIDFVASLLKLFPFEINIPIPDLIFETKGLLAGFCSVSDWIASNDSFVRWITEPVEFDKYFDEAKKYCIKTNILEKIGIIKKRASKFTGIRKLIPGNSSPRQIQTIIDKIPSEPGLTIIEATTGSGKTEAALALAWKQIANGDADSIVFALPTQATADAMLERLQNIAPILFEGDNVNMVLAHGKRNYNPIFANIKAVDRNSANLNGNLGLIQCVEWIASSRKRVFLGQIGVCTIDQVLLSVLPVRHNFVRSFGLMKSVLIIDEVHAYDRYMYGLLEEVLKRQKIVGGSAILLSATLPAVQKQELFETWDNKTKSLTAPDVSYPLISRLSLDGKLSLDILDKIDRPLDRKVKIELISLKDMEPNDLLIERLQLAVRSGATVAVVCNIVQSAQKLTRELRKNGSSVVDIFHARYRFKDRQKKELIAKSLYGKDAPRNTGRVLIATQVIEQSLDLDFDWLLTQLCPIDLLFQRMGRLHRHERNRPKEFKDPFCTILSNKSNDFGAHEMIYGDVRLLWRTRELLKNSNNVIFFPYAYRNWIESVYGRNEWNNGEEPDAVIGKSCAFRNDQKQMWYNARTLANDEINPYNDTDQNTVSLTRGKEMGLTIVPIQSGEADITLLDGEKRSEVNEFEWDELLNLNSVSSPAAWKDWLPRFEDGYIYLPMIQDKEGWVWQNGNYQLKYTVDYGLERMEM